MSRIDDLLKKSIFYIYSSKNEAQDSSPISATGFLFGVPMTDITDRLFVYAVTNKHVVNEIGDNPTLRINLKDGGFDVIETEKEDWNFHPLGSDLAIYSLELDDKFDFSVIHPEFFLSGEFMKEKDVGAGNEVIMIGNFHNIGGKQKNIPVVRFGQIAQMPEEPLTNSYTNLNEESFLVEMRSISGFSGSPVILSIPWGSRRIKKEKKEDSKPQWHKPEPNYYRLLGIDWGHTRIKRYLYDRGGNKLTEWFYISSVMTGVVPSWKLEEMIFSDDEVKQRKEIEKNLKNRET